MKDLRVITIILLIGLCFFLYFNKKDINFEKDLYDEKITLLKKERDSLNSLYFNSLEKIGCYKSQIDSLQNLKRKIKYVYIEKYKEIDSANAIDVYNKFKDIFSKNNIGK